MRTLLPRTACEKSEQALYFDEYVGEYQLAPGLVLNITPFADQLWMQATVQPGLQRFPESNFFLTGANVQMKFVKDTSLKVTAVVRHRDCKAEQMTN